MTLQRSLFSSETKSQRPHVPDGLQALLQVVLKVLGLAAKNLARVGTRVLAQDTHLVAQWSHPHGSRRYSPSRVCVSVYWRGGRPAPTPNCAGWNVAASPLSCSLCTHLLLVWPGETWTLQLLGMDAFSLIYFWFPHSVTASRELC